jgi:hypothetical protein
MQPESDRGHHHHHHRHFPRELGRFINLEGGLYGLLQIVAITNHEIELQTGDDFVRLNREQVGELRAMLDRFLTDHCSDPPPSSGGGQSP